MVSIEGNSSIDGVAVETFNAHDPTFVDGALEVARANRIQYSDFEGPSEDRQSEFARTVIDLERLPEEVFAAIGTLVSHKVRIEDHDVRINAAYALVTAQDTDGSNPTVEVRGVCVRPDVQGKGLSALAAHEALSYFKPDVPVRDNVNAARSLVEGNLDTVTPYTPGLSRQQLDAGNPVEMTRESVVTLPSEPNVGDLQSAIGRAHPHMPQDYIATSHF